jgi:DNA polymerase-1
MSRIEEYASQFGEVPFALENQREGGKEKKVKKVKGEKVETRSSGPAGPSGQEENATEPAEIKVTKVSDKYRSLATEEEIEKALAAATKAGLVAVDTETTGLDPLTVDIVGVSLAWKEKEGVFIPFNQQLKKEKVVKLLKPFLENPKIEKGGQNSKYDWAVFKSHGIHPQGFAFDTMIESFLLDSSYR